jgi:AcrR family transcriptional regulator
MKSKRRQYDASGRQAAAQLTHDAIVGAAMKLLRDVRPEQLSYADVAKTADVALRTVYRHFPAIEDLLAAVVREFFTRMRGPRPLEEMSLVELAGALETFHANLTAEPGLYRLFFVLPSRSGSGFAAIVQRACSEALARIPEEHHPAVCAAVELLLGPYAWEVFHTHWQVPPPRMTRTLLVGVQLLLDGFVANPRALATSGPLPSMFRDTPSRSTASNRK